MLRLRLVTTRRFQLVVLLVAALIFSGAQCLAACAAEGCSPAAPPCHQHQHPAPGHETSATCGHDFLIPSVHRSSLAHIADIGFSLPSNEDTPSFVIAETPSVPAFSPPNPPLSASSILRI
jgi:hypothetical protein